MEKTVNTVNTDPNLPLTPLNTGFEACAENSGNSENSGPFNTGLVTVTRTATGTSSAPAEYWSTEVVGGVLLDPDKLVHYPYPGQSFTDQTIIFEEIRFMQNQTTGLYEIFIFDLIERKLVNNTALVGEAKTPDDAKMKAVVKAVEDGLIKSTDIDSYQIIVRFISTLEPTPEGAAARAAANKQSNIVRAARK